MNRHAKAPSAFTFGRKVALALVLAAMSLLALAPAAFAGKKVDRFFPATTGTGTLGGQFNTPRDIAFSQTGAGAADPGDFYVVDTGNHRIQRFSSNGNFERAFGANVLGRDERQFLKVNATAGTYTLTFDGSTTEPIAFNASSATVDNFLDVLPSVKNGDLNGDPNVLVTGTLAAGYTVTFAGSLSGANVPQMTVDTTGLNGGASVTIETLEDGAGGSGANFEICTTATLCRNGIASGGNPADNLRNGAMSTPQGIAINQATGDLYVRDLGNRRVNQYDADGNFIRSFGWDTINAASPGNVGTAFEICPASEICKAGTSGVGGGQFASSSTNGNGIAVAPASAPTAGNVFASDPGDSSNGKRVMEFDPTGNFLRAWGWDAAAAGDPGDLGSNSYEICTTVCKSPTSINSETAAGQLPLAFADSNPGHLTVDGNGIVYASDSGPSFGSFATQNRVRRFDSSEATAAALVLTPLTQEGAGGSLINGATGALKVSPGGDRLFIARGNVAIQEFDVSGANPQEVDRHMQSSGLTANGLDIRGSEILVTSSSSSAHRVYVLDDDGASAPLDVTVDPPTGLSAHTANFTGTVNPGGFPTSYRFEYSKSGAAGTWTAVAPMAALGTGTSPVNVPLTPAQGQVTNLEANSLYRVRIVGNRGFGNDDVASPELIFATHAVAPETKTAGAQQVSETAAQLVGEVNPNSLPTSFWFEYGPSASYGQKAPVPSGNAGSDGVFKPVSQQISGLIRNTTYHFRLCAANSQGTHCGADATFVTRPAAVAAPPSRAYEMVTPPFKATRSNSASAIPVGQNANIGVPSLSGDAITWGTFVFPLTEDVAAPEGGDNRIITRTPAGWVHRTQNTLPFLYEGQTGGIAEGESMGVAGSSGDLSTFGWYVLKNSLLPSEGDALLQFYTRREGTGVEGFSPWLANTDTQWDDLGLDDGGVDSGEDAAIFNDEGSAMARWGRYRGLAEDPALPGDEDPSDEQQLFGEPGGKTAYLVRSADPDALPGAAKDLINECTGTLAGADATELPARVGTGISTDTIGAQACEQGNVTSTRGAVVGSSFQDSGLAAGTPATAMSADGRRVFFTSPDVSPNSCEAATGAATNCPAQLYVRSYDDSGEATVRWISRTRSNPVGDNGYSGPMIAGQQVAEMGAGVTFQGASRDGRYVYFKTNAPLTPDDPNGGKSIVTDAAQSTSWDLYRYALPADPNADPGDGVLTRITGGPSGSADAATNETNGGGTPLRFHSDDGKRAYFTTTAPIAGADSTPPKGGSTTPGGAVANTTTRNLYLFDDHASGADRYRFIAQLPVGTATGSGVAALNVCASAGGPIDRQLAYSTASRLKPTVGNCTRGNAPGHHFLFFTGARLTADDLDDAGDIYLYDAERDELIRVTAPPGGSEPFECVNTVGVAGGGSGNPTAWCNGTLSTGARNSNGARGQSVAGDFTQARGWGGMRYENISEDANGVVSVYFETRIPMVPEDTNGNHYDVYQWRDGVLSLVSPGNSPDDAWFSGNSLDGRDVFIFTSQRIDPREIDSQDFDMYDARVGGGFPYTPPPTPCDVLAFACEVEAIPAAAPRSAASAGFAGTGNVAGKASKPKKARRCAKGKVRKARKCVAKRNAKRAKRANTTRRAGK